MSMNKYTALLLGVRIPSDTYKNVVTSYDLVEEAESFGLDVISGEGSKYVYIGNRLVDSDPYSDDISMDDKVEVMLNVEGYLPSIDITDIKLWYFDYWG